MASGEYKPKAEETKKKIEAEDLKEVPPAVASATDDTVSIENLTEADILTDAIVAKPLGYDTSLELQPSDILQKNCYYRWVNRYGGSMRRYQECVAIGYINATKNDVKVKDESMIKDGCIVVGDLILMKMDKLKAYGAMKASLLRASELVKPKNQLKKVAQESAKATNAPADFLAEKVKFFTT